MNRFHRRLAAVFCAGLLAPIGISSATSAAIDQDLVVSATTGAPGDVITASSATCPPAPEQGELVDRFLRVTLVSGTGADAVLAGAGWGYGSASFIVPDWVDPAAPASLEASCVSTTFGADGFVDTSEAYDPVAFDVLAGSGTPVQTSSFSRTSLLVGQSFAVAGTGCPSGNAGGGADLLAGSDLSGRTSGPITASGYGEVDGGNLDAQIDLIELGWGVSWSTDGTGRPSGIEAEGDRTDIPVGTYTSVPYCGVADELTGEGAYVLLPPSLIDVTGSAPIDDLSVDVEAGTRDATVVGASCTAGAVEGAIDGLDLVAASSEFDAVRVGGDDAASPFGPARSTSHGSSDRSVGHEDFVPFTASPAPDGSWSHADSAGFDVGVLAADATCGDPLAEGFTYDIAVGVVEVAEPVTTTAPSTPVAPVSPVPATAVPGSPTYAG